MSNPNNPSDFAQVRLTAAGLAFTGQSETLRFGTAHSDYVFVAQIPQKVLRRGELPMFLAYSLPDGSKVFELAPIATAAPAAAETTEVTHAE